MSPRSAEKMHELYNHRQLTHLKTTPHLFFPENKSLLREQESQCKLQVGSEPLTATIECFTLSAQPQEGPKHTLVALEVCSP
jgi:Tfp pilus assembly protein PilE